MTESSPPPDRSASLTHERSDKRFDACVNALNFELNQFWKQSFLFWTLIGAAFVALAVIEENRHSLQAAISSFGFIASCIWTLANRGSRHRYEEWRHKLIEAEESATGPLYGVSAKKNPAERGGEGLWEGIGYSPTKLIIALSDYIGLFWFGILAYKVIGVRVAPSLAWPYASP